MAADEKGGWDEDYPPPTLADPFCTIADDDEQRGGGAPHFTAECAQHAVHGGF